MLISIVIPYWNASETIGRTLNSVFTDNTTKNLQTEVIVVDDGSEDRSELQHIISSYPSVRVLAHDLNMGMCAARNCGIEASTGEIVLILDADDELVYGWQQSFSRIVAEWPEELEVCYSACINSIGMSTVQEPDYRGVLTLLDILNERYTGEYLPMFRGKYIRKKPYLDLGTRKSCGILSYINFALDGPFWVTTEVLRIYHDDSENSITSGWLETASASETVKCYTTLLDRFEMLYQQHAPQAYRSKLLKLSVYLRFAGYSGSWDVWRKGASLNLLRDTVGAAIILVCGRFLGRHFISKAKKSGIVRKYG